LLNSSRIGREAGQYRRHIILRSYIVYLSPAHTCYKFMADRRFRYSRVALKKYVKANNKINATDKMFDALFNKALKTGVEKGEFSQPKGK